ncbi:MAG: hypothetical protein V3U02_06855, partial [Calditrichia bacterium]
LTGRRNLTKNRAVRFLKILRSQLVLAEHEFGKRNLLEAFDYAGIRKVEFSKKFGVDKWGSLDIEKYQEGINREFFRELKKQRHEIDSIFSEFEHLWSRITEITEVDYEGDVYDFNIPTTHSYYANGFLVHNSDVLERVMELKLGKAAYNAYYIDRAEREFTQAIGRGLRRPDQKLYFFSPDITCHRALQGMGDVFNIEEV